MRKSKQMLSELPSVGLGEGFGSIGVQFPKDRAKGRKRLPCVEFESADLSRSGSGTANHKSSVWKARAQGTGIKWTMGKKHTHQRFQCLSNSTTGFLEKASYNEGKTSGLT